MNVYSKDLLTDNILLYCRPLITQHRTTTTHMAGRDQTRRLPVLLWQHYDIRVTLYSILLWNVIVDSKVLINFSLLKFQSLHRERVDLTYSEKFRDSILHIYSTRVLCTWAVSSSIMQSPFVCKMELGNFPTLVKFIVPHSAILLSYSAAEPTPVAMVGAWCYNDPIHTQAM